jgi:hypothetical protein
MSDNIHGIRVDRSRDSLFDELGLKRLKESYMREDESSPQDPVTHGYRDPPCLKQGSLSKSKSG